jgi:hypothetical protein
MSKEADYPQILNNCEKLNTLVVYAPYVDFKGCRIPPNVFLYHPCKNMDTTPIVYLYLQSIYSVYDYKIPSLFPNLRFLQHHPHFPPPFKTDTIQTVLAKAIMYPVPPA